MSYDGSYGFNSGVRYVRDELKLYLPIYKLIQDCLNGEVAVKKERTTYLPKPNPSDTSDENADRYNAYLLRAVFYNVTSRTHAGLVGEVFAKNPIAVLPSLLEPMFNDVNGEGLTLEQSAKKATGFVVAYGRSGLFTDYPATNGETTIADLEQGNIKPTVKLYEPQNITNWRHRVRGSRNILELVVLKETYVVDDDGFEQKTQYQYRVLRLTEEDVYTVEIWRSDDNAGFEKVEEYTPTDSNGSTLDEIPFTFVGSENNDSEIDNPPLYDMASLNIAHYRNSADYEESSYMVGQPTPVLAGLTEEWVNKVLEGKVTLGSRAAIPLPEGGSATLLQAEENIMPLEAMKHKERQMVALGAKLVEQQQVQRTATEAGLEASSESSVLASIAHNVAEAYRTSLKWAAEFIGVDSVELEFELNTDFMLNRLSTSDRAQIISEWQNDAITTDEMRNYLRSAGIAMHDDDEYQKLIDKQKTLNEDQNQDDSPST